MANLIEWKPILNYEGIYEINNLGDIRPVHPRYKNKTILKSSVNGKGYCIISLAKNKKATMHLVHRLVAEAFIPNPDNLPCINHKDENKTNNCIDNLEWCTYQYNNTYGNRLLKSALKHGKKVICVETSVIYQSTHEAQRQTNINQSNISSCCLGKTKTAGGYHWKYV